MTRMKKLRELETLCTVHRAIKFRMFGSASEIADKIGLSRSCLYKYINEIENLGGEVSYSRSKHCFYYQNDFELKIKIETSEINRVFGGRNIVPSTIIERSNSMFELIEWNKHNYLLLQDLDEYENV